MTAIKPGDAEIFLRKPPATTRAVLFYGPDSGLAGERAERLAKTFVAGSDDPFSIIRIGAGEISADAGRIADEASSVALFGGRRAVWIKPDGHDVAPALSALQTRIGDDVLVIVEAGDLRPTSPVRKLFEKTAHFAAVPCYGDTQRDLADLIAGEAEAAGLKLDADARAYLLAHLGGDRRASRGEIQKLCLYAHGAGRITLEDAVAVVGDVSALELDTALDAMGLGELAALDRGVHRLLASGSPPAQIAAAAIRHAVLLSELRAEVDAGRPIRAAVDAARPPIFFKRRDSIQRQIALWPRPLIDRALDRLHAAERVSRTGDQLAAPGLVRALLEVAAQARKAAGARLTY